MKRLTPIAALLVAAIFASPSPADASQRRIKPTSPYYAELLVGGGVNTCVRDGGSKCDGAGASYNLFGALGLRIKRHLGVHLDLSYGALSIDEIDGQALPSGVDASFDSLIVMPTVRGFFRTGPLELFGGLGAGYTKVTLELTGNGTETTTRDNFTDVKLNFGGTVKATKRFRVGLSVDYIALRNDAGELCRTVQGSKTCDDVANDDDGDIFDLLQANVIMDVRF